MVMGGANEAVSVLWGSLIGMVAIIAAFLTTLTMVGFATFPIEKEYFGTKFTIYRNLFSFFASISVALLMGVIL